MAQSLPGGEFSGAYQVAAASDGTVWLIVRSRAGEGLPPVPFGYKLTFILGNDEAGNVTSVNFIVDDGEMEYPPVEIVLTSIPEVTSAELAPIVALELNLVGPGNLQTTRFRSGAGTITYSSSTTLTAQNAIPLCAALGKNAPTTGESSNSVYGLLPSLPASTLVQSFGWSNP